MNSTCNQYFDKLQNWKEEFEKLRAIFLEFNLNEELKWGKPCYTLDGSNIAILQGFKNYCAILFVKGALIKDSNGILVKPGENTQAARQIRFTNVKEITEMQTILKNYINDAIDIEKSGQEVKLKDVKEYTIPDEFQNKLNEMPSLKTAFEALTPGRQKAYIIYFSEPKQSKTRESRIEKHISKILNKKGLND